MCTYEALPCKQTACDVALPIHLGRDDLGIPRSKTSLASSSWYPARAGMSNQMLLAGATGFLLMTPNNVVDRRDFISLVGVDTSAASR